MEERMLHTMRLQSRRTWLSLKKCPLNPKVSRSYLSDRGGALAFPTRRGQHCHAFWQLKKEFQGGWITEKSGEGMGQGWEDSEVLAACVCVLACLSYPGFRFTLYSCLYYPFIKTILLWNKMGYNLKVIIPSCPISWLYHTLHEKQFDLLTSPRTKLGQHTSVVDTGVLAHSEWACGLEKTHSLFSGGSCYSSSAAHQDPGVREFFLKDGFVDNLEIAYHLIL